jgi:hypothetical protein
MHHDLPVMVQNIDVHGAGMQVDAAVKLMLLGVEAQEVSPSCIPLWYAEERTSISINRLQGDGE